MDAHHQCEPQRRGGDAHHNGGKYQHMRQWVRVTAHAIDENRRRAEADLADGDVENKYRRLKDIKADNFFYEIGAGGDYI